MSVRDELISILGYEPSMSMEVLAEEWQEFNPNRGLTEWVERMREIGALR